MKTLLIFFTSMVYLCSDYSNYFKIRARSNQLLSKYIKPNSNNFQNQEHKQVSSPVIRDGDDLKIYIMCDYNTNVLYYRQTILTKNGNKDFNLILDTGSSDVILYDEGCDFGEKKGKDVKEISCSEIKENNCTPGTEEKTIEYEGGKFTGKDGNMTINYLGQKEFLYKSLFANKAELKKEMVYDGLMGIGIHTNVLNDKTFISNFGKSVIYFEYFTSINNNSYIILSDKCKLIKEKVKGKKEKPTHNEMKTTSDNFFETEGWFVFEKSKSNGKKTYSSSKKTKFILDSGSNTIIIPKSIKKKFTSIDGCEVNNDNLLVCTGKGQLQVLYFAMGNSQYKINLNEYATTSEGDKVVYSISFSEEETGSIGQNFLKKQDYCLDLNEKKIVFKFEMEIQGGGSSNFLMYLFIGLGVLALIIIVVVVLFCMGFFSKKTSENEEEEENYEKI